MKPSTLIFYAIEETMKTYRKLSSKEIKKTISDITVDQALVLQMINDKHLTQTEIADLIFKDYASMTRIIALMIKKDYLIKRTNERDRRVSVFDITKKGDIVLKQLTPIIEKNRKKALCGLTTEDLHNLKETLNKINQNCKK